MKTGTGKYVCFYESNACTVKLRYLDIRWDWLEISKYIKGKILKA